MPVNSTHPEYDAAKERWRTVGDAVDGQEAVKKGTTRYLPDFVPPDSARYEQYLSLAYYVNVTGRTKNGLVGAAFKKDPSVNLPSQLEYLKENADGAGQSLVQVAKKSTGINLAKGRYGFLADYPTTESGLSQEEVEQLGVKASIKSYDPESMLNWKIETISGQQVLTMVMLEEMVDKPVDEFSYQKVKQYRELKLVNGKYEQRLYDKDQKLEDVITPRLPDGSQWTMIPFVFVGSEDNTPTVDMSPLFDLANINLAHYRNVADVESSLRVFSQVMLHVDIGDMSVEQWTELNPNGVMFGSAFGLQTIKGKAELIQAEPHNFGTEAIKDKEQQMVSVGARLISTKGINQTAEEARINASSESSVLDMVVGNTSEAIEQAIEYCAMFMGADPNQVEFSLNREFFDTKFTAQEYMALIQFADRGDIAKSDVREVLRRTNLISDTRTDEAIEEDLENIEPV